MEETEEAGARPSDAASISLAIRRNDRLLVRWLAQKFGDMETARDIAQSTYLRVWSYAQTREIDNLKALIFKTAANLAANEFRARRRLRSIKAEPASPDDKFEIDQVACDTPSPEAAAVGREEVDAAIGAINSLPEKARRAFLLSRFEEKTYREIGEMLDVSESSVEKYIIAALKALRTAANGSGRSPKFQPPLNRRNRGQD